MSRSCLRSHRCAFLVIVFMNVVIMTTIMLVITLMIVTGSAKAVSVRCAKHLGCRGRGEPHFSPRPRPY
jgi:hypothetical protein